MGLKSDLWIKEMSKKGMIEPFCEKQVGQNIVSYGLSSYGYDIRVGSEFMIFTNIGATLVDPKSFDERNVVEVDTSEKGYCLVPPNSFALARTIEYFRMPRNVLAICLGKSTYARCGIIVNVTPFEPEFEGHITIEISNTTPLPAKIPIFCPLPQVRILSMDFTPTSKTSSINPRFNALSGERISGVVA